jgi:ornithine--oxo-acid transaminase
MSLAAIARSNVSPETSLLATLERDGIFETIDALTDRATLELTNNVCAHNYHPLPIVIRRAHGVNVWDEKGKEYIDMIGSYSAVSHGHLNAAIVDAMKAQCDRLTLTSRAVNCPELPVFMSSLCEYTSMDMGIPMNTGAEAVETAIKIARKWAYTQKTVPRNCAEIIVANGNFHGRTTTIVGFSSEPQYKELFGPFSVGFSSVPFGDVATIEAAITPQTAAILLEPIQAEAGILIPPEGYMTAVRKLCTEHNVLLIWDEIQTGFCRTGRPFAWQWEPEGSPDLLTLGKALGGGVYPVSAVVGNRECMSVLRPGDHGSTFGGNPLACVVGIASILELRKNKLDQRSEELGRKFRDALRNIDDPRIVDIRGRGLLVGLEIDTAFGPAAKLLPKFLANGIITKDTHAQTLRFAPPLTISEDELDEAVVRIKRVFN